MLSIAHILHTERETRRFRLLCLLLAAVTLYFRLDEVSVTPAIASMVAFLVYTLVLAVAFRKVVPRLGIPMALTGFIAGMALADGVFVGAFVYYTGGITAITVILVPLFIIYHTIYLGYTSGFVSGIILSSIYLGTALWGSNVQVFVPGIMGQIGLFLLLPVLGGYLAKGMMRAEQSRQGLRTLVRKIAEEHGVTLSPVVIRGSQMFLIGDAPTEAAFARLMEEVQGLPTVLAVRLGQTGTKTNAEGESIRFMLSAKLGRARQSPEARSDPPGNEPGQPNPIAQLISKTRGSRLAPAGNGGKDG